MRTGTTDVLALVPADGDASGSDASADDDAREGGVDRIVRRPLDAAGNRVVYSARGIDSFATVGRTLAVLRTDQAGDSSVDLVPLTSAGVADGAGSGAAADSASVEHLTMPSRRGHASALHVAADGSSLGFVWADTTSGTSRDVGLYTVDLTGTHMPTAVTADGHVRAGAVPMTVSQWAYVPRSDRALVRTGDDQLLLVDMTGGADLVRLGSSTYVHGFVGNGTTAVVEGGSGVQRIDLTDGSRSSLRAPAIATESPYLGPIAALTDDAYLRLVGSYDDEGTLRASLVRVDRGTGRRLDVRLPTDASVTGVCPSPNGQLVAVATRSASSSLVTVVDASTGALAASLDGTTVDWCESIPSGADPSGA